MKREESRRFCGGQGRNRISLLGRWKDDGDDDEAEIESQFRCTATPVATMIATKTAERGRLEDDRTQFDGFRRGS